MKNKLKIIISVNFFVITIYIVAVVQLLIDKQISTTDQLLVGSLIILMVREGVYMYCDNNEGDSALKIFKLRVAVMITLIVVIILLFYVSLITPMTLESLSFVVAALAVLYNVFVSFVNSYWNEIDNMIVATQPKSPMLYIEYSPDSRACAKCSRKLYSNSDKKDITTCNIEMEKVACVKNEGDSVAKYIRVFDNKIQSENLGIATHMSPQETSKFEYKKFKKNLAIIENKEVGYKIYGYLFHTDFSQRNIYTQILYSVEVDKVIKFKEFRFRPIILDRNNKFPDELDNLINLDYFFNEILSDNNLDKEVVYSAIKAYRKEMII